MITLVHWLKAFRLKTLSAAFVPVAVSVALVHLHGAPISWNYVIWMILSATSIQIATNLFNDAIDFKKGADQVRTGPMRVTQAGLFSVKTVYLVAIVFCGIALLCGVPLVLRGGWPLVSIGLSSLFLAYGYTGGPYPLAYKGLGDFFVILFFGLIAVMASYYVLTLQWSLEAFVLGLQVGFLSTVLIAINNLRDSQNDLKVGKLTLAARFGDRFAVKEIIFLIVSAYLMMGYWIYTYSHITFVLFFLSLPLAIKIISRVRDTLHKDKLGPALGMSALLSILFGFSFCIACVV